MCVYVCLYVYMFIRLYVYIFICLYFYVFMFIYLYICIIILYVNKRRKGTTIERFDDMYEARRNFEFCLMFY